MPKEDPYQENLRVFGVFCEAEGGHITPLEDGRVSCHIPAPAPRWRPGQLMREFRIIADRMNGNIIFKGQDNREATLREYDDIELDGGGGVELEEVSMNPYYPINMVLDQTGDDVVLHMDVEF